MSLALLTLMERFTPRERAVFVLLHGRARQHLGDARLRFEPDQAQWRRLVERFLAAAQSGDVAGLRELLAAEVTATPDGGGKVSAARSCPCRCPVASVVPTAPEAIWHLGEQSAPSDSSSTSVSNWRRARCPTTTQSATTPGGARVSGCSDALP